MRMCIGSAFYHTRGKAPNLHCQSEKDKLSVYYRCLVVFFASARLHFPDEKLVLFSNVLPLEEYLSELQKLRVVCEIIPSEQIQYVTGSISNSFPGCLFSLDVFQFCNTREWKKNYGSLTLFDSDCVIRKSINLPKDHFGAIKIFDYPVWHAVNGQSRITLSRIAKKLYNISTIIDYFGGEYYHIPSNKLNLLNDRVSEIYSFLKATDKFGVTFTEEHILTLVFSKYESQMLYDPFLIKRIWTANTFNNVVPSDKDVAVYHLPAEKERLFRSYYVKIVSEKDYLRNHDFSTNLFNYVTHRANPPFPIKILNKIKKMIRNPQRRFKL